jgi:hypothetical protein
MRNPLFMPLGVMGRFLPFAPHGGVNDQTQTRGCTVSSSAPELAPSAQLNKSKRREPWFRCPCQQTSLAGMLSCRKRSSKHEEVQE